MQLNVSEDQRDSISNKNVKRILAFLKNAEKRINWNGLRLNNAIFIFGNTGAGKTKLAQFLSGTNEDLISCEVGEDSQEFIIYHKDDNIDADSTIVSKTIYPQLYYDLTTGDIYVDFGGFNDAGRDVTYDFTAAYFIKKVMEKARHVKIILTADHSSVRKGVNRNDFPSLLQHVCVLLKHTEKYLDGVALIVTKVDSNNNVSDDSIIENIARFIIEVKQSILSMQSAEQIYSTKSTEDENQQFVRNASMLIDALVQKNDAGYSRLGIFRRPNAPGPLSEIRLLQEGKTKLKSMLENNLKFVPLGADDIAYTISFKSKYIIRDLVDEIHENVEEDLNKVVKELLAYYERTISSLSSDKKALEQVIASSQDLDRIRSIDESTSLKDLVGHIQKNLTETCKRVINSFIVDIENLDKFLDFLGNLSARSFGFCAKKWIKLLKVTITYVQDALASLSEAMKQSAFSFCEWMKEVLNSFMKMVQDVYRGVIEFLNGFLMLEFY